MAGVRLRGLTRIFTGGVVAVEGLELEIRDGEFLVLLGPSGCGKTTTLRLIAGLEAPSAGTVLVGDRDVTELPPRDRDVAMVFQNYALYPHMTVRQNLAFGLRMRKTPKAEIQRRVDAAAEILDIGELLDRKPGALSGGQRQRVALGRAIVREPDVFLFDEPLSNLDAKLRVHTRAELVRLHRRLGTTMVYVTHDQTEAMTMGERIAILDRGVLQQVGPPLEVYDRPANLMVAGFIGSPPMNTYPGRLEHRDGVPTFVGASLTVPLPERDVDGPADVVLGVRPEDVEIRLQADGGTREKEGGRPPSARGTVAVVEPLGSETLLYCRTDADETMIARVAERPALEPESPIEIRVAPGKAHLFDAATGDRR